MIKSECLTRMPCIIRWVSYIHEADVKMKWFMVTNQTKPDRGQPLGHDLANFFLATKSYNAHLPLHKSTHVSLQSRKRIRISLVELFAWLAIDYRSNQMMPASVCCSCCYGWFCSCCCSETAFPLVTIIMWYKWRTMQYNGQKFRNNDFGPNVCYRCVHYGSERIFHHMGLWSSQ